MLIIMHRVAVVRRTTHTPSCVSHRPSTCEEGRLQHACSHTKAHGVAHNLVQQIHQRRRCFGVGHLARLRGMCHLLSNTGTHRERWASVLRSFSWVSAEKYLSAALLLWAALGMHLLPPSQLHGTVKRVMQWK